MLQVKLFVQYMYLSVVQKLAKIWCFFEVAFYESKWSNFFPAFGKLSSISQVCTEVKLGVVQALQVCASIYRIHLKATPGFYFSKWIFGWGLFKKSCNDMTFLTKAGVYSRNGSNSLNSSNGTNASNSSNSSNGSNCSNNSNGSNPTLIVTVSLSIHECQTN